MLKCFGGVWDVFVQRNIQFSYTKFDLKLRLEVFWRCFGSVLEVFGGCFGGVCDVF